MAIMRYDSVLDGLTKLLEEVLPATLRQYRAELDQIKTDFASADTAKRAVETEVQAHRGKLLAAVDAEIKTATSRKEALETAITALDKERTELLAQVDGVRATIQAVKDETSKLVHEREMTLHTLQGQIDTATARHTAIR